MRATYPLISSSWFIHPNNIWWSSSLCILLHSQIFSSAPCSQTPSNCVLLLVWETKFHISWFYLMLNSTRQNDVANGRRNGRTHRNPASWRRSTLIPRTSKIKPESVTPGICSDKVLSLGLLFRSCRYVMCTRVYPKVSGLNRCNEINNNKHSFRSNTNGYDGKTHKTDSQISDTAAPNYRELNHFAVLSPGGQSGNFWIQPLMNRKLIFEGLYSPLVFTKLINCSDV
jgi:hypothetical protein